MEHPFRRRATRPELPDTLPMPPLEIGTLTPWYELKEPEDVHLYVTFTGSGRAPDRLFLGWLYVVAADGAELRRPTFEEIYSAADYCGLDGVMWELPPFRSGHAEIPEGTEGVLVHFRQIGAEEGTPAHQRYNLTAGGGMMIGGN